MISFLIDGRSQKRQRVAIGSMIVRTIIVVAVQMTPFRSIIQTLIKSKGPCVCGRSHQSRIAMKRTHRLLRSMTNHRSSTRRINMTISIIMMTARRRDTAPSTAIPRRRSHGIVMNNETGS